MFVLFYCINKKTEKNPIFFSITGLGESKKNKNTETRQKTEYGKKIQRRMLSAAGVLHVCYAPCMEFSMLNFMCGVLHARLSSIRGVLHVC